MSKKELFKRAHIKAMLRSNQSLLFRDVIQLINFNSSRMELFMSPNFKDKELWMDKFVLYYKEFLLALAREGFNGLNKTPGVQIDFKGQRAIVVFSNHENSNEVDYAWTHG